MLIEIKDYHRDHLFGQWLRLESVASLFLSKKTRYASSLRAKDMSIADVLYEYCDLQEVKRNDTKSGFCATGKRSTECADRKMIEWIIRCVLLNIWHMIIFYSFSRTFFLFSWKSCNEMFSLSPRSWFCSMIKSSHIIIWRWHNAQTYTNDEFRRLLVSHSTILHFINRNSAKIIYIVLSREEDDDDDDNDNVRILYPAVLTSISNIQSSFCFRKKNIVTGLIPERPKEFFSWSYFLTSVLSFRSTTFWTRKYQFESLVLYETV